MLGLKLTVEKHDVVDVAGDLYVKTPKALKRLMRELRYNGYVIENLRNAGYRKERGVEVSTMEKNGWSLWFAKLPNIRHGVCGSCNQLISTRGIQSHGHKCEKCGSVTYYELVEGSLITFVFNKDKERGMFSPQLKMEVHHWDTREGYLYLCPEPLAGGLSNVTGELAQEYLNRNSTEWTNVEVDGLTLMKVKYPLKWDRNVAAIEPYDIYGHKWNHKIVKVWKGKRYSEYDRLPVPETISIYESWHWHKHSSSPKLHSLLLHAVHQVDDKGYYYQDGRQAFWDGTWTEMAKFVRHFTTLDADAFDRAWPRFRKSGPGGIDDLARFCHTEPDVRDEPNIGNVLIGISKSANGQSMTRDEINAAKKGLNLPEAKEFLAGLLRRK